MRPFACKWGRPFSSDEQIRPELMQRLLEFDKNYADARSFKDFSLKEIKDKIPPAMWAQITANDPIYKYPEFAQLIDIQDVLPQNNPLLPNHLTRPAILLSERQQQAQAMTLLYSKNEARLKRDREIQLDKFPTLTTNDDENQCRALSSSRAHMDVVSGPGLPVRESASPSLGSPQEVLRS